MLDYGVEDTHTLTPFYYAVRQQRRRFIMSVLNTARPKRVTRMKTHEGGEGRKAEVREELAMLALSSFLSDSFYERGGDTISRMQKLVAKAPRKFVTQLARVARQEFNMRTTPAALVGFYTLEHGQPQDGRVIRDVFFRGDEIGDYLATVASFSDKGKVIPSAVRFGRAVLQDRLTERSALRYSNFNRNWNLAKAIRITHARAESTAEKRALFDFVLLWKSEGSLSAAWERLPDEARMLLPVIHKAVNGAEDSGEISWERSRSAGASWESVVDNMGYMALLRNLRNFFEKVPASDRDFWNLVANRLADPEAVANSKQLPFRFLSAHRAISGSEHTWWYHSEINNGFRDHDKYALISNALSEALDVSVGNLPAFEGRTLILVDTSGSMDAGVSDKSQVSYVDIATLFGAAMFRAQNSAVVCFGTTAAKVPLNKNHSVLANQAKLSDNELRGRLGYGTNMSTAFARVNVNDFDNIVVFSDMQIHDEIRSALRGYSGNVYSVNLAAYEAQMTRVGGNFYTIGGWADSTLKLMSMLSEGSLIKYIENY